MKKHIAVVLSAVLTLTNFTACNENVTTQTQPENQVSVSDSSTPTAETSNTKNDNTQTTTSENGTNITTEIEPAEKVRGIYGETEIPDIPYEGEDEEGKSHGSMDDKKVLENCLDNMVFETHACGEYKISLVGDSVRTDKANFPGSIYTRDLRIEVEKNGTEIKREEGEYTSGYCDMFLNLPQFETDFRLFEDKIGSYIDMYELNDPVIAMRYFYDDNPERTVKNAMEFAVIHDNNIEIGFFGISDIGTGIILDGNALGLNSEDGEVCRMSTFAADEFEVLDGKTLFDNVAGIKFTFNFINPQSGELYTAEKVAID